MWRILLWWMLLWRIVRRRPTQTQFVITRGMLILLVFVIAGYWIPGTGFPGKTLWDWMQLLIVPAALAVGGYIFNRTEKQVEHQRAEERAALERKRADEQAERERYVTEENQREAALQAYLDQMTTLLLEKNLRDSQPRDEVRMIALIRTLTTIRRLDYKRRNILLRFLHDARLIAFGEDDIIDFRSVDLAGVDLSKADLQSINLEGANLEGANLEGANLLNANLQRANLQRANLQRAILVGVNFEGAILGAPAFLAPYVVGPTLTEAKLYHATITDKQLATCCHLNGAYLPDGTRVPDDVDNPFR